MSYHQHLCWTRPQAIQSVKEEQNRKPIQNGGSNDSQDVDDVHWAEEPRTTVKPPPLTNIVRRKYPRTNLAGTSLVSDLLHQQHATTCLTMTVGEKNTSWLKVTHNCRVHGCYYQRGTTFATHQPPLRRWKAFASVTLSKVRVKYARLLIGKIHYRPDRI
jgi:hypothetical protein